MSDAYRYYKWRRGIRQPTASPPSMPSPSFGSPAFSSLERQGLPPPLPEPARARTRRPSSVLLVSGGGGSGGDVALASPTPSAGVEGGAPDGRDDAAGWGRNGGRKGEIPLIGSSSTYVHKCEE